MMDQDQKELIQAGKLAALGQMSAALSHEINQPLTWNPNMSNFFSLEGQVAAITGGTSGIGRWCVMPSSGRQKLAAMLKIASPA